MLGAEIAAFLAASPQSYGTVNTNIFYNAIPATPDVMISVMEYGGSPDEPNLGTGGGATRLEYPRFQIVTRGIRDDSDTPALKIIQIRATLVAVLNQSLVGGGPRYVGIDCLGPPEVLDVDDDFRVLWRCNFASMKIPSTS